MSSKWLWQMLDKAPERLTEQEKENLSLLALDPRTEALRRFLDLRTWQILNQMVSSPASEQARWHLEGELEAYRAIARALEPKD